MKNAFLETHPTSPGKHPALICSVIALAVILAYANSLRVPFLFDDQLSILENPTIRQLSFDAFSPPGGAGATVEGRPILNISLALNYALSGTDVRSYHVTNLAIHVLAALTFFGLVRRTLRRVVSSGSLADHATEIALAATLLWALHPLQTESVTYIVQRTESLMGLFYLLTLYAFVRGTECYLLNDKAPFAPGAGRDGCQLIVDSLIGGRRRRAWLAGSIAACALGMGTKEVMVSAPLMVLLYDRTFVAGSFREAWRQRRSFYLGLAATWLVLGWLVLGSGLRGGTIGASAGVAWWQYAFCQARAIVHYVGLAVWPSELVFDYGSDFVTFGEIFPHAVLDLGLLALTAWALWRRPMLGFLGAWFFVILAPTTSVLGGTRQMLAEHRMYLSLAALAVLAAIGIRMLLGRRGWIAWSAIAVALGLLTVNRNADYRSDLSIYRDTVAKRPGNAYAFNNLGRALMLAGRYPEAVEQFTIALRLSPARTKALAQTYLAAALSKAGRSEDAVAQAQAAVNLNPNYAEAHYNLGTVLLRLGRPAEALGHYATALRLKPDYSEAHFNLAVARQQLGETAAAISHYDAALRFRPDYPEAHVSLGTMRAESGQWSEALAHFGSALRLEPNHTQAHFMLGNVLCAIGRVREAIPHFEAVVRAAPDNPEYRNNLGSALLEGAGRLDDAITQFDAALRLRPDSPETHFNLGVAHGDRGNRAEAIRHLQEAVRLRPDYAQARDELAKLRGAR